MWQVLCVLVCWVGVGAYPNFKSAIPNGNNVPDPCSDGIWSGVGHFAIFGGGPLNPFGTDFGAEGRTWTKSLCQKDSDGDGKTNGEELGDPQCTFTPAGTGQLSAPTGHPGICEPVGDPACAAQTFTCAS